MDAPIPVIINPAARSARTAGRLEQIGGLSPRVMLRETQGAGDARRFARELTEAGEPVVVAAGGDGTINEIIAGMAEASAVERPVLGLLPAGTMNVFARELGLPSRDLEACWRIIEAGRTRAVDVWRAGAGHFIQMAGIGLDAMIVRDTTWEAKKKYGPFSYMLSTVRALSRPTITVRVRTESGTTASGPAVLIGNGTGYGGPFRVFPEAVLDDGMIDVFVIHEADPARLIDIFAAVATGQPVSARAVTRLRARRLDVESAEPVPCEVDGEQAGQTPFRVEPAGWQVQVLVAGK